MGLNLSLVWMFGAPEEVLCPNCGKMVPSNLDDYDIESPGVNPEPGVWHLHLHCEECRHDWQLIHRVQLSQPLSTDFEGDRRYMVTLNEYHRSNLLTLLQAIGYPGGEDDPPAVEPFHFMNTGDWVGEIAIMLDYEKPLAQPPNHELEELRRDVERWGYGLQDKSMDHTAIEFNDPAKKKQSVWMDEEDIAAAAELLVFKEGWFPKDAEVTRLVVSGGARVDIEAKVPIDWKGRRVKTSWERLNEDSSDE